MTWWGFRINLTAAGVGLLNPYTADVLWFVIFNPASGRVRNRATHQRIEKSLSALGVVFEIHETIQSGDAERLAQGAYLRGRRHFVVAGGDGTAHEVINGLLVARGLSPEELTVALIPLGTGNDWARSLRIPTRLNTACRLLVTGQPVPIDVGTIDFTRGDQSRTRYFVNMAGAGFDAQVVRELQTYASGRIRYYLGLMRTATGFKSPVMTVHADDWSDSGSTLAVFVSTGKYLGGGMRIAPQAKLDDGLFEVTVVAGMSGLEILGHIPRLLFGSLARSEKAQVVQAALVTLTGVADIQADGELLGQLPCSMRVIPGALRVMVGACYDHSQA